VDTAVFQWVAADPGKFYRARVSIRGKVSSWTKGELTMGWLTADQEHIGAARTMRLPAGEWPAWVELSRAERAPPAARWVGIGLRVQHQTGDDWVDADDLVLEEIPSSVDASRQ
jgi:hypothetical protein